MKPRLCVYITDATERLLADAARRPGASKSAIADAALASFLTAEGEDARDGAIVRRLDRMTRQYDRLERNLGIATETLALYIRLFLTVTPPVPNADQDAARALGKERFEHFTTQLARRLAGGRNMVRDVLEEIGAEEAEFFSEAELDALKAAREERATETADGTGGAGVDEDAAPEHPRNGDPTDTETARLAAGRGADV